MHLTDGVGVGDVPQEEGVPGHGGAGGAAVAALDDLAEFLDGLENRMDALSRKGVSLK